MYSDIEKQRAYQQNYYLKYKEKINLKNKLYAQNNRERLNELARLRRKQDKLDGYMRWVCRELDSGEWLKTYRFTSRKY